MRHSVNLVVFSSFQRIQRREFRSIESSPPGTCGYLSYRPTREDANGNKYWWDGRSGFATEHLTPAGHLGSFIYIPKEPHMHIIIAVRGTAVKHASYIKWQQGFL